MQVEIQVEQEKVGQITKDETQQFGLLSKEFLRRHGLHLLGTTSAWFLLDIAFYSQNLFQKDISNIVWWIPPAKTMNLVEEVFKVARTQTLIALCNVVSGYWLTVLLIRWYREIQYSNDWVVCHDSLDVCSGNPLQPLDMRENRIGFVVMYAFMFFFANFGPNATTVVVPAEIFPTSLRSTCRGISTASGETGTIVGVFGFLYLAQNWDKAKADAMHPACIGVKNPLMQLLEVAIYVFGARIKGKITG